MTAKLAQYYFIKHHIKLDSREQEPMFIAEESFRVNCDEYFKLPADISETELDVMEESSRFYLPSTQLHMLAEAPTGVVIP